MRREDEDLSTKERFDAATKFVEHIYLEPPKDFNHLLGRAERYIWYDEYEMAKRIFSQSYPQHNQHHIIHPAYNLEISYKELLDKLFLSNT